MTQRRSEIGNKMCQHDICAVGSEGWDPKVERAHDALLEAAEYFVKIREIPNVMETWRSGAQIISDFATDPLVEELTEEQRSELISCLNDTFKAARASRSES